LNALGVAFRVPCRLGLVKRLQHAIQAVRGRRGPGLEGAERSQDHLAALERRLQHLAIAGLRATFLGSLDFHAAVLIGCGGCLDALSFLVLLASCPSLPGGAANLFDHGDFAGDPVGGFRRGCLPPLRVDLIQVRANGRLGDAEFKGDLQLGSALGGQFGHPQPTLEDNVLLAGFLMLRHCLPPLFHP
jgi:hypothetical protein